MCEKFVNEEQLRLKFGEKINENQKIMEAVMFALSRAVEIPELARACGCDNRTAETELKGLMDYLEREDGALIIRELDGKYQLCSNPRYYEQLIKVVSVRKKPELSEVLMETLAVIAGKSPATRTEVEKVRGVKSDFAVNKLIEYGLIEEAGRLKVPGRPSVFRPTEEFYRRFGIENKYGMPEPDGAVESELSDEVRTELKELIGEV